MRLAPAFLAASLLVFASGLAAAAQDSVATDELRLPEARAELLAESVETLLVFGAAWCPSCRVFREQTLSAPEVGALLETWNWHYLELDREPELTRAFGIRITPTFVVLSPEGIELRRGEGALPPDVFMAFLAAKGSGALVRDGEATELLETNDGWRSRNICYSQVGYGPLDIQSQAPGHVLRQGIAPRAPSTLAKGQREFSLGTTAVSVWNYDEGAFKLDYGSLHSTLALAYGISDTWMVELEYSELTRTASWLDPITDEFHSIFGFGDSGRADFPSKDNDIFIAATDSNPAVFDSDSGSYARDIGLTFQNNVTCGSESMPALAWALTVRGHTGGEVELTGSSPFSGSLSVSASRRFAQDHYAYGGLSYSVHGLDSWSGLPLAKNTLAGLLAYEWQYKTRRAFLFQVMISEGVARNLEPFNHPSYEIHLGWKRELSPGAVLEWGIVENAIIADNSPDFGLHLAYRRRF
ncbi:MAG: thioredoxin-related protein [Planctomycetota bacterium]